MLAPAIGRITRRAGRTPRAVTADRGYGEAAIETDLHDLGVRYVAIPRKAKPSAARRAVEHRRRSANTSSGAPDPKGASAPSSAATDGTAPG